MMHVLAIRSFHPAGLDRLLAHPELSVRVLNEDHHPDLAEAIAEAEIVTVRTCKLRRELLDKAPRLRLVVKHGVGIDTIDVQALTERGIPVAIAPTANARSVAEHTLALLFGLSKNLLVNDTATRAGDYGIRDSLNTCCVDEKNVLVCGYGRIGRAVAQLCHGVGMRVFVYDPFLQPDSTDPSVTVVPDLDEALPAMDYVCLHTPLTAATRNSFTMTRLRRMKPGSFLINCSRGGVVDEAALYEVLVSHHLAGAGLDVFEAEPPTSDIPLFALPNVIVSPHNAAMSREGAIRMAEETTANILDFIAGALNPAVVVNKSVLSSSVT